MRTTLKRGIGRGATVNGNGRPVLPPGALSPITIYRQPEPPPRSGWATVRTMFAWAFVALLVVVGSAGGGAYLWFHESVADVVASTPDVKVAAKRLDVALPGHPATALVIGYDKRAGEGKGVQSRSDTVMLVRADPDTKSISMMSFPRDLFVQIHCPGKSVFGARINNAYAYCGSKGTLETVRKLTGLPINYLITVNFRGFRQLVDAIGGVWLDVDRRYFNDRGGDFGYATINLFPGYQKLGGYQALDFVRYRHTDSDLYRVARQQLFVRAFKDQVKSSTGLLDLPKVIKTITRNVEVGVGGNAELDGNTILEYALFAYSLPPGHFFQSKIEGLEDTAAFDVVAPTENIQKAVQEFSHPDVESPQKATQVALNEKPKVKADKAPPPRETTITVLNGNGVTGSAGTASYLLSQRGYQMVYPPDGKNANAPNWEYFKTRIQYDKSQPGAKAAAKKVATLFGSDDVAPVNREIAALSNGALLTVIVGQTFHGTLAEAPVDKTPQRQPPNVAPGADASLAYLRERAPKMPFKVMVPTVLERSSWIDRERPVRMYRIDPEGKHKTIRLTYRTGAQRYWGVQMTDWEDAPVLAERNFIRSIGGRRYELHYTGPKLHMVVLRQGGASYWVVNTLLDELSNETMLAIAKGLKPLASIK
ncbi:MAG: polyisoprenyl-teichoic acid--peptidoglycan teichoic acid transferase [Gaiellaceae bacterium]|jgi:LCP family protein required for cell wall assembly|nr:polyisoprenyl-teichoic acid--peptidoglycan teichoic acid transferase [Gaiellaceae bacterium]